VLPAAGPVVAQNPNCRGIWISNEELKALPMSGTAWSKLKSVADGAAGTPVLSNQDDPVNVRVMAKALVYARTGVESYRSDVITACMAAIDTENGGRTLALARELGAYVIAADLVGLPAAQDDIFRTWLKGVRNETLDGKTLISTHEVRPNNWGTQAGFSRAAVAAYLGEDAELARCAKVFRGWCGDRTSYSSFTYADLIWQTDPSHPVGINPKGGTIAGHVMDGGLPEELRRASLTFVWPPPKENYVYTALEGSIGQAVLLNRAGFDTWGWQDQALLRAYKWLHDVASFPATGNDTWQPHVINYYYGSSFPAPVPSTPGKSVGWTDWTHGSRSAIQTGIHGVVKNGAGSPISQATVTLQGGSDFTAQSNLYGCYHFVNAPAGTYTISATASGFGTTSDSVTLTTGKQIFGKNIVLQAGGDSVPPKPPSNVRVVGG
jgi:hypothetical protein